MEKITFDDFKNDVMSSLLFKPKGWRDGQTIFNYIDCKYGVARYVQFEDGVDCFYNDDVIDEFILASYNVIERL